MSVGERIRTSRSHTAEQSLTRGWEPALYTLLPPSPQSPAALTSPIFYIPGSSSLFQGPYSWVQNYCSAQPSSSSQNVFKCLLTLEGHKEENPLKHMGALPRPLPSSEGAEKAAGDTAGRGHLAAGSDWLRPFRDLGSPSLHKDSGNTNQTNSHLVVTLGHSDPGPALSSCLQKACRTTPHFPATPAST